MYLFRESAFRNEFKNVYLSVLINETAFIVGKKHVTFRHYNFMSSSDYECIRTIKKCVNNLRLI